MADPTNPLFSVFAFLGFVAGLVPFPWHLQAWNAGTCTYMIWASFACLIEFVDSVLWNGTAQDLAPVWCDISTKFLIGAGVGIPASSLCINRRLYNISSCSTARVSRQEKQRAVIIDLSISVGIPVLVMILHYVVQGHRFNILEDIGCVPEIYNTPPAYPLVFMWPVLLGCISFVYAALTLRAFWKRRAQFKELVAMTSGMTASRYFRLMLLSISEMMCTIPIGAYSIYINTDGVELAPWISWSDTHYNFSHVEEVPSFIWRSNRSFNISVEMGRWIYPFSAFLFFALFGFAEEARKNYRLAFWCVAKRFGFNPAARKGLNERVVGMRVPHLPLKDSPPAYKPPARTRGVGSTASFTSSIEDIDLEKGGSLLLPTPSTAAFAKSPSETSTFEINPSPMSNTYCDSDSTIHALCCGDDNMTDIPFTQPAVSCPVPAVISLESRPFSPPSVELISPTRAQATDNAIHVTVHTSVRTA